MNTAFADKTIFPFEVKDGPLKGRLYRFMACVNQTFLDDCLYSLRLPDPASGNAVGTAHLVKQFVFDEETN